MLLGWAVLGLTACGGSQSNAAAHTAERARAKALGSTGSEAADSGRCSSKEADHEVSEYDTSGDDVADVRRVYKRMGTPPVTRLVLICREADLNADGVKDIVRYYNDEGRPLREEADRYLDGRVDEVTYFQDGQVVRRELDSNGDGTIDTKHFYVSGTVSRSERDIAGRSSAAQWHPDRWEYFEQGSVVRMGTDLDGDGKVDHWDRDALRIKPETEAGADEDTAG